METVSRSTRPMEDGQKVNDCPLPGNLHCFWSCGHWTNNGCSYPTQADRKQLEDMKAMREEFGCCLKGDP